MNERRNDGGPDADEPEPFDARPGPMPAELEAFEEDDLNGCNDWDFTP